MKRIFPLLALLALAGCSTTSNDITQNLKPLPAQATSWQCDSGNRIILQQAKDGNGVMEMLYRNEKITMTMQDNVLTGDGLVWQTNGISGTLSGTYRGDVSYTEHCTQVLRPAAKE